MPRESMRRGPVPLAMSRPDCAAGGLPRDLAEPPPGMPRGPCLPLCARRRSVIVYDISGKGHRAGLLDRANHFASLGNLAASLCAHVVVGRPCDLLAAKHNVIEGNETLLNCSITHWQRRYLNLSFLDGEPVMRGPQWHDIWRRHAERDPDGFGPPAVINGQPQLPLAPPRPVDTRNASELVALYNTIRGHWLEAATLAKEGRPFEWHIRDPLWSHALAYDNVNIGRARVSRRPSAATVAAAAARSAAAAATAAAAAAAAGSSSGRGVMRCPHPPSLLYDSRLPDSGVGPTCVYVQHTPATVPNLIAQRFLTTLGLRAGGYAALHLRRGDKANPDVCNTTVERVVEIASSALPRLPRLILFTDERRDTPYLRELLRRLSSALAPQTWVVDLGEPLMLELSRALDPTPSTRGRDNFLVFAAELEVYARANASLHVCTACPRGAVAECARAVSQAQVEPQPKATGLMGEWVRGGTG
jgi:hypothetical protein